MENKSLNILVSAYSCSPNWGSEPGMSWNWIKNLAKFHKIYLITSCEFKDELLSGIKSNNLEKSVTVYFNDIGEKATKMGQNQGDWRFYYYYKKWQKKTYYIAQNIIKVNNIDLVHQLNMIGFREPGYLWKLNKPSVWGPIGGLSFLPYTFVKTGAGIIKYKLILKNIITYLQIKFSPRINLALHNFDIIIGANINSKNTLKKYREISIPVLNETGSYVDEYKNELEENRFNEDEFNILWVGKSMFTKQLDLALAIIYNLEVIKNLKFHIVGIDKSSSDYNKYFKIIKSLNIEDKIVWHGKISHNKVKEMMSMHHLFLFTSIMEGTPHVILEAIENQLPIICFDTCGQGECVNNSIGIKIALSNPSKAAIDFSKSIINLNQNRNILSEYSNNCIKRSEQLSWESKIKSMSLFYEKAILKYNSKRNS